MKHDHILIRGDFNMKQIDWETMLVNGTPNSFQYRLFDINDLFLNEMIKERPGPIFYLLSWDPSHLEMTSFKLPSDLGTFYLNSQVTWSQVTWHYLKSLGNHVWDLEVI